MSDFVSEQNQPAGESRLERLGWARNRNSNANGHAKSPRSCDEARISELNSLSHEAALQPRVDSTGILSEKDIPRRKSPSDSSSDESRMNRRTRDLSIDEARHCSRKPRSPNKKRLVGQDSPVLRDPKRTRHDDSLPPGSGSRILHAIDTDEAAERISRHSNPVLSQEVKHMARQGQERTASPEDQGGGEDPKIKIEEMILQLETRPISEEQLVNEVKGIYAGLVMVEKKCVEICTAQASSSSKHLSNEQWQALIALHRTLLHEHHDFFLASQHPSASPALRRLGTKYAMPARMWRHGIHSFLEILRSRLPDSIDHMLSFVYLAYSMMALLMESVPSFSETWIECLGDLARYRMAIEENDARDREIWANVARMWYHKAADRSPSVGRIQHHLAVLARPLVVQQLFYYSKALVAVVPFTNARESIMLLFTPFLDKPEVTYPKYPEIESSLVTAFGILFTKGSTSQFTDHSRKFLKLLDGHISRTSAKWKVQGPEVASSLIAGLLDFGTESDNPQEETNYLWKIVKAHIEKVKSPQDIKQEPKDDQVVEYKAPGNVSANFILDKKHMETIRQKYWASIGQDMTTAHICAGSPINEDQISKFGSSNQIVQQVLPFWSEVTSIVASKVGDRNIIPYLHVTLAFLWSLSFIPGALIYIEGYVPWSKLTLFLNTLGRSSVSDTRVESAMFPDSLSGVGRQLPEDFPMRGLIWAEFYYPTDFFTKNIVDEDERTLELPSHVAPRAERCLWLGVRLATLGRYIKYDYKTKEFTTTKLAQALEGSDEVPDPGSPDSTDESEFGAVLVQSA